MGTQMWWGKLVSWWHRKWATWRMQALSYVISTWLADGQLPIPALYSLLAWRCYFLKDMWEVDPGSRACRSRLVWWRRPLIIWTRMLNGRLPGEAQSRGPGSCLCVWGLWSRQIPPALAAFPGGLALPRASNYRSKGWVVALVRAGGTLPVVQPQALAALGLISQLDLDWAWLRM